MARPQQQQNNYRNNRIYDEIKEPRWCVAIEGQKYYFLDKSKAIRCWQQFVEAEDPVLVSYARYMKDPNR
jgi:hypothetical protein